MIKRFDEMFNESNNNNNDDVVIYRWRESFENRWHTTKCIVLSYGNKTAKIKLLEFGKNNTPPGTQMTVHRKSLIGFEHEKRNIDDSWKKYTYFN